MQIVPTGETLGATVAGVDLNQELDAGCSATSCARSGDYGVLRFPGQKLDPARQMAFSARFGSLEINVAGAFQEPGHPEIMILSNMTEPNGRPIGARDAGQDWHTDMSYSETIAFANVLYALKVPRRDGRPLGGTEFANMHAAYDGLPDELKTRLDGMTVLHDFNKFWDMMLKRPGTWRKPLTPEQRDQEAAGVAPDLPHPPDHRAEGALRQSRLRDPHQRTARGARATRFWNSCSRTSSRRNTATSIAGARAMCCCGTISAPCTTPTPITGPTSTGSSSAAR